MAQTIITITEKGRLTLPASVRRALHIEDESLLEVTVEDDAIVLRPVVAVPREDAWAYTPEHRAHVERARAQPGLTMSDDELRTIVESDDPAAAAQTLIAQRGNG
jgi:AbrB family looped-hinge helix DNA binding protein